MADAAVWVDGALVAPDAATVSVFDHGFTVGDGVFETVRVIDGRPFALRRHLARLHRSADRLGLAVPVGDAALRAVVAEVLAASGLAAARLRITVTAGVSPLGSGRAAAAPTLVVAAGPLDPWPPETSRGHGPVAPQRALGGGRRQDHVVRGERGRAGRGPQGGRRRGDHAQHGRRPVRGHRHQRVRRARGALVTPPLLSGCLAGVTRELVLELLPDADEETIPMAALAGAEEVLLTSSTRDVQPLRALDGRPLPGVDGPVGQRARAAIVDLQARDVDP